MDARVGGVALGGNAAALDNERLEIFRAGVLAGGGARFARDIFFHQSAAVIVGPGIQAKLGELAIQLDPRNLNVVDGTGQHNSGQRVNLEMFGEGGAAARQALMEQ